MPSSTKNIDPRGGDTHARLDPVAGRRGPTSAASAILGRMLLPIEPVEVIMVATITVIGIIMWRAVTAPGYQN